MSRLETDSSAAHPENESVGEQPLSRGAIWGLVGIALLALILLSIMVFVVLPGLRQQPGLGVVTTTQRAPSRDDAAVIVRPFPETTDGIHVFNSQLDAQEMTEPQLEFAATHYVSAQNIFASDARRLRAHNPEFIVLSYRLGLGLGYQNMNNDCQPDGTWLEVIEGEKLLREYPEDPQGDWFFEYEGQRVLLCDQGWYVMDIGNPSWREYWYGEVLRQVQANMADGVFADSLIVPNYYGGDRFEPPLPVIDEAFENQWSGNIAEFIAHGQSGELADYHLIVNAGTWATGRDITDYSGADGVMIEGFGRWTEGDYFSVQDEDWQLQMNRILGLVNLDRTVLLQQYVDAANVEDRLFLLGSYLLVKGHHTYLDLELSTKPEWFPEYDIPVGKPIDEIPASISMLWRSDWNLYARAYSNGLVLVNPSDATQTADLKAAYYQAVPVGGGAVPLDGDISAWRVDYTPMTGVTLEPNQAALLIIEAP
ncbi:MAG: hypothetical protein JXB30_19925 [Anaerolineae bacterium]|nr:hypothetical protein [Anaerolineae bacterium]